MILGFQINRGCASDLLPMDVEFCESPKNSSCNLCAEPHNCNKVIWPMCYNCTSNEVPQCATWLDNKTIKTTTCPNVSDLCLSQVSTEGHTVRSCIEKDFVCPLNDTCKTCRGTQCNGGVYPINRKRCLQCDRTVDCSALQDPKKAYPCVFYSEKEQCFFYANTTGHMIRGCVSHIPTYRGCLDSGSEKCITCKSSGSDGCNSTPHFTDPKLSCSKCINKPSCAWGQLPDTFEKCKSKIAYYQKETCLTTFNAERDTVFRDCGNTTPQLQLIEFCPETGCNNKNVKWQHCVMCSSSDDPNCRSKALGIVAEKCSALHQPYNTRGCYTMTNGM